MIRVRLTLIGNSLNFLLIFFLWKIQDGGHAAGAERRWQLFQRTMRHGDRSGSDADADVNRLVGDGFHCSLREFQEDSWTTGRGRSEADAISECVS